MRQLAYSRTSFLATIVRTGSKQSEDAALSSPSACLLLGEPRCRHSNAPDARASSTTLTQAPVAAQPTSMHPVQGVQSDALPGASWRGFAAKAGSVAGVAGAGFSTSTAAAARQAKPKLHQQPLPVHSVAEPFPASRVVGATDGSSPGSPAPQPGPFPSPISHPGASSAAAVPISSRITSPAVAASAAPLSRPTLPAPATPPTAAAPLTSSYTTSTSTSSPTSSPTSPSARLSSGAYNEPKDGSFSGRIVQHDGSHAVHLLVSGSSARDYNLRMVRCHARDELRFDPASQHAGAGAGGGGGAACGTATARGEDVSFGTFLYRQVRDTVSATFLPAGYPDTTGQNYVRFMLWQGVHNTALTANSVLASTFMLYAVGLGAGSIPTAGALNWVLKDGAGQLGTLLFGKTIAHNFDVHSKTWFFLAAVMLQAAAALELLTVLLPHHFLLMGSLANTLKGLAWMAAGSTRSVFHLSFARDNNIADVTAKGTSQYIFASLVGTAGGALMCAAVGQSGAAAAGCFGLLAAATVGSAYLAVHSIPLATLNATRLQLLVDAFLTSISPAAAAAAAPATALRYDHGRRTDPDGGGGIEEDEDGYRGAAAAAAGGSTHRRRGRYGRVMYDGDDDDDVVPGLDVGDVDGLQDGDGGGGSGFAIRTGGFGGRERGREWGHRGGRESSGAVHRWSRPRAYRTVDRCYIGPSTHEYELMYDDSLDPKVPTPLELSPLDPPLPYFSGSAAQLSPPILVGSRLEHVVEGNANLLVMLLTTYKYAHFMVVPRRGALHVVLHDKADPRDMVQAYLQASILRRRMRGGDTTHPLPDPDEQTAELRLELQESLAAAERLTTIFMSTIEANGWTVAKVVVEAQRRRAKW